MLNNVGERSEPRKFCIFNHQLSKNSEIRTLVLFFADFKGGGGRTSPPPPSESATVFKDIYLHVNQSVDSILLLLLTSRFAMTPGIDLFTLITPVIIYSYGNVCVHKNTEKTYFPLHQQQNIVHNIAIEQENIFSGNCSTSSTWHKNKY